MDVAGTVVEIAEYTTELALNVLSSRRKHLFSCCPLPLVRYRVYALPQCLDGDMRRVKGVMRAFSAPTTAKERSIFGMEGEVISAYITSNLNRVGDDQSTAFCLRSPLS